MNISTRLGWLVVALAWTWGSALPAGDPDSTEEYRYGIRLLAASPRQDFRNFTSRTGLGGGLFAQATVSAATTLETRFDYISYPQTNQFNGPGFPGYTVSSPITFSADSASLGVDVRHTLPIAGLKRVYLLGGLMGIRYEFETSAVGNQLDQNGIPIPGIQRVKQKTPVKLGLAVGLGVELYRGLAIAERYTTVNIQGTAFGTLETSLSYRF